MLYAILILLLLSSQHRRSAVTLALDSSGPLRRLAASEGWFIKPVVTYRISYRESSKTLERDK